MKAEVAIVGNGVAGTACAMRLAREGIRPLLIGPGLPVDRPPLTKSALADGVPRLLSDAARLDERGIDRLDGSVVVGRSRGLHAHGRRPTTVRRPSRRTASFSRPGSRIARRPSRVSRAAFVNANPHVFDALGPLLTSGPVEVIVVGAGLIGTESAATLAAGRSLRDARRHARAASRPPPRPAARARPGDPRRARRAIPRRRRDRERDRVLARDGRARDARGGCDPRRDGGVPFAPPGLSLEPAQLPLAVADDMLVPGYERVYACGDLVLVPHARFGPMRFPHWDAAIGTGEHVADTIAGKGGPYERLPYWWSDIGPRRLAEVGFAGAVATWAEEDGLHVGRDAAGAPVCVLVVDAPRRLREARAIVQDGGA